MKTISVLTLCAMTAGTSAAWMLPVNSQTPPRPQDFRASARPLQGAAAGSTTPSLSWADIDLDGRLETLVIHPDGRAALIREVPGGPLVDATKELGLALLPAVESAHWMDMDGDTAPDLLIVARDGSIRLFRNESARGFRDVTLESGLTPTQGVTEAAWKDVDHDGAPDLLLLTTAGLRLHHNLGGLFSAEATVELFGVTDDTEFRLPVASAHVNGTPFLSELSSPTVDIAGERQKLADGGTLGGTLVSRPGRRARTSSDLPGTLPGIAPMMSSQQCLNRIQDASSAMCIGASSSPMLGKLYPISSNLYVSANTGNVGVGTVDPKARLDVTSAGSIGLRVRSPVSGDTLVKFTSLNTNLFEPTMMATVGAGGISGYFEEQMAVGTLSFGGVPSSRASLRIDLDTSSELRMRDGSSVETVELLAGEIPGDGARLELRLANGKPSIRLDAEEGLDGGEISLFAPNTVETVQIRAVSTKAETGGQIVLSKDNGLDTIVMDAAANTASEISMRNALGIETIELISEEVAGDGAQIVLRKADGTATIILDAEQGTEGRITTDTLQITGGADLVESFAARGDCAPGNVLVIDPENPGALMPSSSAYDTRVIGIVSGAGNVQPGLHLGQRGVLDGDTPIALSGRVFVRCTEENGPIRPGDLLTSSSIPGHAMRASDATRAFGAVIGKALGTSEGTFEGGKGLILVLVSLQ